MQVFISHSKKDSDLVNRVKAALGVMDFPSIVYEDLPNDTSTPDYKRIKSLIQNADIVFLFLTKNVALSNWTTYWVDHEVSLASAFDKPMVVFQVEGEKPLLPIGYFTDVVIVSRDPTQQIIVVQRIAKQLGKTDIWPIGALGGAAVGALLGPVGLILGALIGGVAASDTGKTTFKKLKCQKDKIEFRFWGGEGNTFFCPHCLREYELGRGEDRR